MELQAVKLSSRWSAANAYAYLPLVRYEQQPGAGLAVRKYVLARRGAIASDAQRNPGAALPPEACAEVNRMMVRLERRLAEMG